MKNHEDLEARISELESTLAQRDQRIAELEGRDLDNPQTNMSYAGFAHEVKRRLVYADRNWQIVFENQTGLRRSRFARFFRQGFVDRADYIAALSRLVPTQAGERAHRDVWSVEQVERVRSLTLRGKTETEIARVMSIVTGRNITDNMIKRLKTNSRQGQGIFRDGTFGGSIGQSR